MARAQKELKLRLIPGAYSSTLMADTSPGIVRCFELPGHAWPASFVDSVVAAILSLAHVTDAVEFEVYKLSQRQDEAPARAGVRRVAASVMEKNNDLLRFIDEQAEIRGRVRPASLTFHSVDARAAGAQKATEHWNKIALPDHCRALILADAALAARNQERWARAQVVGLQRPLVAPSDKLLLLPIIEELPTLVLPLVAEEPEEAWTPWLDYLTSLPAVSKQRHELLQRFVTELKGTGGSKRMLLARSLKAQEITHTGLHPAYTAASRAWVASLPDDDAAFLPLAEHIFRAPHTAVHRQICPTLGQPANTERQARCVSRLRTQSTHALQSDLATMRIDYSAAGVRELDLPEDRRAIAVCTRWYFWEHTPTFDRLRLLWMSAVGSEHAADVVLWLKALHDEVWTARGHENVQELKLLNIARFFACTERTPANRSPSYGRACDPVDAASLAQAILQLPLPTEPAAAACWTAALRAETKRAAGLSALPSRKPTSDFVRFDSYSRFAARPDFRTQPSIEMLAETLNRLNKLCATWATFTVPLLLISGPNAERLWPLLEDSRAQVLICGQKMAPRSGGSAAHGGIAPVRRQLLALPGRVEVRSAVLAQLSKTEELCRSQIAEPYRAQCNALWVRRLTAVLEQAERRVEGIEHSAAIFLETVLETFWRAAIDPLLQLLASFPALNRLRTGGTECTYSPDFLNFVERVIGPLALGPAAAIVLTEWMLVSPSHVEFLAQADVLHWLKLPSKCMEDLSAQEKRFAEVAAPELNGLHFSEAAERRHIAFHSVLQFRRRLQLAVALRDRFGLLPQLLQLPMEASGSWSQLQVLGLTARSNVSKLHSLKRPFVSLKEQQRVAPWRQPVAFKACLTASATEALLAATEAQWQLTAAIAEVTQFVEETIRADWDSWCRLRRSSAGRDVLELLRLGAPACGSPTPLQFFLAGATLVSWAKRTDLSEALSYAQQYAQLCDKQLPTRLIEERLVLRLQRSPERRLADARQRRMQVEGWAESQRQLFSKRSKSKGALDGLQARMWGAGADVQCWAVDQELLAPSPSTLRALRSDLSAEQWYASWRKSGQPSQETRRHEIELVRFVLCNPAPAAAPIGPWKPNPLRLGYAQPSELAALDPRGACERALSVSDISQPSLRRLVAPDAVPELAWLALLLQADHADGSSSKLSLAQSYGHKRLFEPITHSIELWPLFAKELKAEDCASDATLLAALARQGSPVPRASAIAAHHALLGPTGDYRVAGAKLLARLTQALPGCTAPSPIIEERELSDATDGPHITRAERARLDRYEHLGEQRWFKEERLASFFAPASLAAAWKVQDDIHRTHPLARPCKVVNRHEDEKELDVVHWSDTGQFPPELQLDQPPCAQPVVLCPRTAGRRVMAGNLQCGSFRPNEYTEYMGAVGGCEFRGRMQQSLRHTYEARGLRFMTTPRILKIAS